jgi:hypothetical protein
LKLQTTQFQQLLWQSFVTFSLSLSLTRSSFRKLIGIFSGIFDPFYSYCGDNELLPLPIILKKREKV